MTPKRFTWYFWHSTYDSSSRHGHSGGYNTTIWPMTWDEFDADVRRWFNHPDMHSVSEIRRVGTPHWQTVGVFERDASEGVVFRPSKYFSVRESRG